MSRSDAAAARDARATADYTADRQSVGARPPAVIVPPKPHETAQTSNAAPRGLLYAGAGAGIVWAGGAIAYLAGYHGYANFAELNPIQALALLFVAVGPAVAFTVMGAMAGEMARFMSVARSINDAATALNRPATGMPDSAARVVDVIMRQIDRLNRASEGSLARLAAMEEVLRHHAAALENASGDARQQVDAMIEDLHRERAAVAELSGGLQAETRSIAQSIDRQAEMVAAAADLASSKADESRELLEQSVITLEAAASSAQGASERLAGSLSDEVAKLDSVVVALDGRAGALDAIAKAHRQNVDAAQSTVEALTVAADAGVDAMRSAVDAAIEQAGRLTTTLRDESERAVGHARGRAADHGQAAQSTRPSFADRRASPVRGGSDHGGDALARLRERAAERAADWRGAPTPPAANFSSGPAMRLAAALGREGEESHSVEPPRPAPMPTASDLDDRPLAFDRPGAPLDVEPPQAKTEASEPEPRRTQRPLDRTARYAPSAKQAAKRPAADKPRGSTGSWRWKDLLDDMEHAGDAAREADAAARDASPEPLAPSASHSDAASALRRHGVRAEHAIDPEVIAQAARARRRGGVEDMRLVILDLALEEVRRAAAAVAGDPSLRAETEGLLTDYRRRVADLAAAHDVDRMEALFDTDAGRAFLLLDAALGDN